MRWGGWASAQITTRYPAEALVGRLVVAVVNFPPKRIGPFVSEVLVMGAYAEDIDLLCAQIAASEFDPNELERIEVLRGPQGAFFGAASLGGLIKYVTIRPSTDAVSGRLNLNQSAMPDGSEGYGASGAINLPLSETAAVRASAFTRHDPGYIDNVLTGEDDDNDQPPVVHQEGLPACPERPIVCRTETKRSSRATPE